VRVADQLVAALEHHHIDRLFGIPGGTISPLFDALVDSTIEVITCQHESMAVYAASGHARATGRPAVVAVTSGPGVLNALTGVAAAYLDEAPILVLAGDVTSTSAGRGPLQDGGPAGLDVISIYRPVTRMTETLWRPERAVAMVEQAFATAMARPRGPVFLRLPVDVTQNATAPAEIVRTPAQPVRPDVRACNHIASLLHRARRPAIMLGVGARETGLGPAVVGLAEWLRCPVLTDLEAKGVFPESHPLSLGIFGVGAHGPTTTYLAEGVDVLVTLGARLDDTTTISYSELLQPEGPLVQIDYDPDRLARSYGPDLALCCDLEAAVKEIRAALPAAPVDLLLARDQALREARATTPAPKVPELGEPPHDPRAVVRALQDAFGPDAVFTGDIGNHMLFAAQNLRINRQDGFFVANGLGGMGSGIGNAVGLQSGYGTSRQVVAICGDAGTLMVGNELATCARFQIPLVLAVFNDGQLGMVQHGAERVYGRSLSWERPALELVKYATALGCDAITINDLADLQSAAAQARSVPLVLDIPVNPDQRAHNPRDATLNFPGKGTA
jgi:acetolactate synthase-1/2/3 large subunit